MLYDFHGALKLFLKARSYLSTTYLILQTLCRFVKVNVSVPSVLRPQTVNFTSLPEGTYSVTRTPARFSIRREAMNLGSSLYLSSA